MVRKGTRNKVTSRHRRYPNIRTTNQIYTRRNGAVRSGPRETCRVRVKIPPGINTTRGLKECFQSSRTLPPGVRGVRASAIHRTIEDCIEVPTKECGDSRIELISNLFQKLVPCRVAVRGIQRDYTKRLIMIGKLTLQEASLLISPRLNQRQRRTEKDDTTTRFNGTRRDNT